MSENSRTWHNLLWNSVEPKPGFSLGDQKLSQVSVLVVAAKPFLPKPKSFQLFLYLITTLHLKSNPFGILFSSNHVIFHWGGLLLKQICCLPLKCKMASTLIVLRNLQPISSFTSVLGLNQKLVLIVHYYESNNLQIINFPCT